MKQNQPVGMATVYKASPVYRRLLGVGDCFSDYSPNTNTRPRE